MDHDKLVRVYLKMRDAKSQLNRDCKAAVAELDEKMGKIEACLLASLNSSKVNSMGAAAGTFYKELDVKATCQDWNAYHTWIKTENAWEGLEKRVGQGFIREYLKDNNDEVPPGIIVLREHIVRVRAK